LASCPLHARTVIGLAERSLLGSPPLGQDAGLDAGGDLTLTLER
jgi:hypothetical protein